MCIIVDANVMSDFFLRSGGAVYDRLVDAVFSGSPVHAVVVYGGKLTREYAISPHVLKVLAVLDRNGRARHVSDQIVDSEEHVVRSLGLCRSDDEHVVALARMSGARLLCSNDARLMDDFRDHRLVSRPRGSVYARAHHEQLLRAACRRSGGVRRRRRT